ncbi:hypothetical protein SAMN05216420_104132 [Nitrosospira sp. Nl5]|nr:hypothetical protein SAMN05216420_104132 [Nitrosospira sp. Nl5]
MDTSTNPALLASASRISYGSDLSPVQPGTLAANVFGKCGNPTGNAALTSHTDFARIAASK